MCNNEKWKRQWDFVSKLASGSLILLLSLDVEMGGMKQEYKNTWDALKAIVKFSHPEICLFIIKTWNFVF